MPDTDMGEAKRRAAHARLQQGLEDIRAEGAACWAITIISPHVALELLAAAVEGDPAARTALRAGEDLLRQITAHSSPTNAPLCLFCDNALWRDALPAAMGFLSAYRDDPRTVVGHAICPPCAAIRSHAQLQRDVLAKLKAEAITDLRLIQPSAEVGHG